MFRARLLVAGLLLLPLGAPVVRPADAAAPLMGIDSSVYQHDGGAAIDWRAVKRSGQSFAFLRVSHGTTLDSWYLRDRAAARAAGLIIGSYHYADPRRPAEVEAAQVTRIVGTTRQAGDLGIVLDLEDNGGLPPAQLSRWAHTFLDAVQARTGRTPIVYSGVNFWKVAMAGDRSFGAYPLWIPRYADTAPAPNAGWSRWTFWQHTNTGRVPGVPGLVDRNKMCCSLGTLQALADGRSTRIAQLWKDLGGASGQLGLPLGTEQRIPGGWGQVFEKGYVASTSAGTIPVLGALWARYKAEGGPTGALGLPRAARRGPVQQFAGGGLYVNAGTVRLVPDTLRDAYEERGGHTSALGLPTSDAEQVATARAVTFQNGRLVEIDIAGQKVIL